MTWVTKGAVLKRNDGNIYSVQNHKICWLRKLEKVFFHKVKSFAFYCLQRCQVYDWNLVNNKTFKRGVYFTYYMRCSGNLNNWRYMPDDFDELCSILRSCTTLIFLSCIPLLWRILPCCDGKRMLQKILWHVIGMLSPLLGVRNFFQLFRFM